MVGFGFRLSIFAAGACLFLHESQACPLKGSPVDSAAFKKIQEEWGVVPDREPAQSIEAPFGGPDPSRRVNESHYANFMLRELKPSSGEVVETAISFPANFEDSDYAPFGDGQTNSHIVPSQSWKRIEPPVVLKRELLRSGKWRETVAWDPALKVGSFDRKDSNGWVLLRPAGWSDWFALNTATQMLPYQEFAKGLPKNFRFADGRGFPDPEGVLKQGMASKRPPIVVLLRKKFGKGYNDKPFPPPTSVHGRFPNEQGKTTAVGAVLTWLVDDRSVAPIKHLYTCFQKRRLAAEAETGAPSGAGWHKIGVAGETIVHSMERAPLLSALAIPVPGNPPSHQWAFGFTNSVSARWLKPGEVFVTTRGQRHWYVNPYPREVCTEIWVHNCDPSASNNWGFNCQ